MAAQAGGGTGPESSQPWMFGGRTGSGELPWEWAEERLAVARTYWIATTRPDGRPHSRPVWGVWSGNAFYFSTGSLAARDLAVQPAITVHLEGCGNEVVIIEGTAGPVSDAVLTAQVVDQYNRKYDWNLDANNQSDPFYAVRPRVAFGWHFADSDLNPESSVLGNATRWRFR